MKKYCYAVWFTNGKYPRERVIVFANSCGDAIILAQAKRIEDGLDRTYVGVERLDR